MTTDQIDAAIAAASKPQPEQRTGAVINLGSGRRVELNLPADITDAEYVQLLGLLALDIRPKLRQPQRPPMRLLVPR